MLVTITLVLIALITGRVANAEDEQPSPDEPAPAVAERASEFPVVVLGRLVCIPCLMNEDAASADLCELFNHGHQILVDVAESTNEVDLADMAGELLDYEQPPTSQGPIMLGEEYHGRKILVHGAMVEGRLRVDRVRTVREPTPEERAAADLDG